MLRLLAILLLIPTFAMADELAVDIRAYGGRGDGVTDNSPAFRKAIEAVGARVDISQGMRGTIFVPGAAKPYLIQRPINLNRRNVWIVGDGHQSMIWNVGAGPAVVVGMRDTEPGPNGTTIALDPKWRVPREGKLDGSVGGRGVRTGGDSTVLFAGGAFDLGPANPAYGLSGWAVETLVVDLILERNADGGAWPGGKVEGILMLGGYGSPTVLAVQKGGNPDQFDLILSDRLGQRGTVSFRVGPGQVKRMSVQVDLKARTAAAWADRVQVPTTLGGPAFGPSGAGSLCRNERDAMLLGCTTGEADGRPPVGNPRADLPDWTFYGLSLSAYPKYQVGEIGSPQKTAAGAVVNDSFAVGMDDARRCVAMLYGQDPVSPGARWVDALTGTNGFRIFYGYQLQRGQYRVWGGQERNGLRDLQLVGPGVRVGPTVHLFSILDFRAERCRIRGGTQAIGVAHGLASYVIKVDDCDLEGSEACVSAAWSLVDIFNSRFDRVGRTAVRTWASNLTMVDSKLWFQSPNTDHLVAAHGGLYGGATAVRRMMVDFEGEPVHVAPFLVGQAIGLTTTFSAEDVYLGNATKDRPLVKAIPIAGGSRPFTVELRRIDDGGAAPSVTVQSSLPGLAPDVIR